MVVRLTDGSGNVAAVIDMDDPTPEGARVYVAGTPRHRQRIIDELRRHGYRQGPAPCAPEQRQKFRLPAPKLAAVTVFYNPAGFHRLRENYDRFADQFTRPGWPPLYTVEIAIGRQKYSIPKTERVKRLRAAHPLWFKENAINLAARDHSFIPDEFNGIAWIDCDMIFSNENWPQQTAERLRDLPAVQLYHTIHHQNRYGARISTRKGVVAHLATLDALPERFGDHCPGGAWAAHRDFLQTFGLYERFITGGGDAMAHSAMMGQLDPPYLRGFDNPELAADYRLWAAPVARHVRGDVAHIPGEVDHLWHGDRENRQYRERRHYLEGFDPESDLHHNPRTGLLEWATDKPELHVRHTEYFNRRKEDG